MPKYGLFHWTIASLDAAGEEKVMDEHQSEGMRGYLFLQLQKIRGCDHLRKRGLV